MVKRLCGMPFTLRLLALVAASGPLGGCCGEVTTTQCFAWDQSATCPAPEEAAPKLGDGSGTVTDPGTFWPAHDYLINGVSKIEPVVCCYEVTSTSCVSGELH